MAPWTVTFDAPTLPELLAQIDQWTAAHRRLLGAEGSPDFMRLDGPLPPAAKRAPKDAPTEGAIRAAREAQAPGSRSDVEKALRLFVKRYGERQAMKLAPKIMGAARISDIRPEDYDRVATALAAYCEFPT
jgi:hypothetical protein